MAKQDYTSFYINEEGHDVVYDFMEVEFSQYLLLFGAKDSLTTPLPQEELLLQIV